MEVHPRVEFKIEAVDNSLSDISYFSFEELDAKHVAVKLAHSLEDLVDRVSYWCLLLTLCTALGIVFVSLPFCVSPNLSVAFMSKKLTLNYFRFRKLHPVTLSIL